MLRGLLHSPSKIFILSLLFAFVSLLFNGGLVNLYSLHRDRADIKGQIIQLHKNLTTLDTQLKRARDPAFIERQALDQLDMASAQDLVFVFSE